ncbi:MAG: hypothetical protein LKJ76_04020 [Lachnospiraceae bacterium]|nr:hypothetical protein [Lachnospiraceae bacterium]
MARKVYVEVILKTDREGKNRPLSILWEDGTRYEVDRLLDVRRAASLKVGGGGMRYVIMIRGQQCRLFEEDGRWFVEADGPEDGERGES